MNMRSIISAATNMATAAVASVASALRSPAPLVKIAFEGGPIDSTTFNLAAEMAMSDRVRVVMQEGEFLYRRTERVRAGCAVYVLAS